MPALCTCGGRRFQVTITAADAAKGTREAGPTLVCCELHLTAARLLAAALDADDPTLAIEIDASPVAESN